MRALLLSTFLSSGLAMAGEPSSAASIHPADRAEWAVETGYVWEAGHLTSIDYEIIPTQFVYRSPAMLEWFAGADGSRLVVRTIPT